MKSFFLLLIFSIFGTYPDIASACDSGIRNDLQTLGEALELRSKEFSKLESTLVLWRTQCEAAESGTALKSAAAANARSCESMAEHRVMSEKLVRLSEKCVGLMTKLRDNLDNFMIEGAAPIAGMLKGSVESYASFKSLNGACNREIEAAMEDQQKAEELEKKSIAIVGEAQGQVSRFTALGITAQKVGSISQGNHSGCASEVATTVAKTNGMGSRAPASLPVKKGNSPSHRNTITGVEESRAKNVRLKD